MTAGPAQQDPEATFAFLYKAIARMPENVDAMIGLAGTHLQVGQLHEASDWCARAFAIEPSPRVIRMQTAIGKALVKQALQEVIAGRMNRAVDMLARTPDAAAPRYRELLLTTSAWFEAAQSLAPEPDTVRLSLPVWGADYVRAASSGLLRTMLAPGNLPALGRKRKMRLEITTTGRDRAILEAHPILAAVRQLATVDYFIIPDEVVAAAPPPNFSYWVMSAGHHASMERAYRTSSAVSFFTADMLLSDGSLDAAQRRLEHGAQAVLIRALEADRCVLAPEDARADGPLSLSGRALVDHGLARLGLDRAEVIQGCRVLTPCSFAVTGGYVAYGFHFLPLMVSAELTRRPFVRDLLTVDTRIVRLALGDAAPGGRVEIVTDPDEIAIASTLTTARGDLQPTVPSINQLARWGASWCFEPADTTYFEWCFDHRIVFPFSGATVDPTPSALERATVGDVISAFRHHAARFCTERAART